MLISVTVQDVSMEICTATTLTLVVRRDYCFVAQLSSADPASWLVECKFKLWK